MYKTQPAGEPRHQTVRSHDAPNSVAADELRHAQEVLHQLQGVLSEIRMERQNTEFDRRGIWPESGTGRFTPGEIWEDSDGQVMFRIVATDEQFVEVQWCLDSFFGKQDSLPTRHLLTYITSRELSVRTSGAAQVQQNPGIDRKPGSGPK
jgi:hypothetical protein